MDPIVSLSRPHSKGGFSNGLLLPSCSLYLPHRLFFPQTIKRTRNFRLKRLVPRAASASPGLDGSSRRVRQGQRAYQQSQGVGSSFRVPVNEVVSVVAPAGVFLAVTFGAAAFNFMPAMCLLYVLVIGCWISGHFYAFKLHARCVFVWLLVYPFEVLECLVFLRMLHLL